MRIAWFIHRYHPCHGGSETFARAMIQRFIADGHDVDVLTSDAFDLWYFTDRRRRRCEAPAEEWIDGARVRRFAIRHIPLQRYVGRLLSYLPHWPTQCKAQSYMPILPGIDQVRGDYDAVFGVGFPFTVFSYAAYRTARAAGAPLILVPFLHLATPGDPVHRHYTRPHQIRLLKEAETVIVQTGLEAMAVQDWGIPPARIFRLGMGFDRARVTGGSPRVLRERLQIPDGRAVVGHLAVLDPNKGSTDLVLAVERLNAMRPADDPIHLLMVGATSPCFEAFLSRYSGSLPSWLSLLGPIPNSEVADFFAALDLFAMPSRTDSFGIVFLEAWANKLPVVAAAAGGVPDVVHHGKTGLLVPFGDLDRLGGAIQGLLDDRDRARQLGEAGWAHIKQGHTWDDKFAILLERTLQSIGAPRLSVVGRPRRKAG
jgi:glycosyltransferase involved in cell wall biosynthesis